MRRLKGISEKLDLTEHRTSLGQSKHNGSDDKAFRGRFEVIIDPAILSGPLYSTIDQLKESFYYSISKQTTRASEEDASMESRKALFAFTDAADSSIDNRAIRCRPCDACGGKDPLSINPI